MDPKYEEKYYKIEETHAWSRGRRSAILRLLESLGVPRDVRGLEVGCGSGMLLKELRDRGFRDFVGVDISDAALRAAASRGLGDIVSRQDAVATTFDDDSFDLVIASDVLEHLLDEGRALAEWQRVLRPTGHLIVFVPAFDFLWSDHDAVNRHFRRYSRSQLESVARGSGFEVCRIGYWNTALFFPVLAMRMLTRARNRRGPVGKDDDFAELPGPINGTLAAMFEVESALMRRGVDMPLGVSVYTILRRQAPTGRDEGTGP